MRYKYLDSATDVEAFFARHAANPHIPLCIDLETTGLNPREDKIVHVVASDVANNEVVMFSPDHVDEFLYLPAEKTLILHNFKFDFHFLKDVGRILVDKHTVWDTMLLHHLLDENKEHGLDAIIQERWKDPYKEQFWADFDTYEEAPLERQLEYACKDVYYTAVLYSDLCMQLRNDGVPDELLRHVHYLAYCLYRSESKGIRVDEPYLQTLAVDLKERIVRLRRQIREAVPVACESIELDLYAKELDKRKTDKGKANVEMPEFNPDSTLHLQSLLYGKLKLPKQVNQKTKRPSTDDAALEALEKKHPVVPVLREYRGNQKIYTAFIEGTYERMYQGRVYPSFNVNGTVTGRISSSGPNLQQLPREGGIRGIYIPDEGHVLVSCDFSQLEICIAAHYSDDPFLLDIVRSGESMHDSTASACGIDRQAAKMVNFLTIYGGTEYRLSVALGISFQEAKRILDRLWETYGGLKRAIDECHARVERGEPIVSIFGRKRRFPEGLTAKELARAQRQAFNALVQGTGSDITHRAFYTVAREMAKNDWGRALFEVHDEILIMPKKEHCEAARAMLQSVMVKVGEEVGLKVPLRVDCSEGLERWEK